MNTLTLPPLLNPIEAVRPFETAIKQVRRRKSGAGDLFWTPSLNQAEFAIVLEPDVAGEQAAEMLPLGLVALSDCLAALLPPQVAVQFRGHHNITVNGGVAGGIIGAMARQAEPQQAPDWLVLSIKLDMLRRDDADDPGLQPDVTTLGEEGWEAPDLNELIETYARHFLSWLAVWDEDGFSPVARAWKFKAENEDNPDLAVILKNMQLFESTMGQ